MLKIKVCSLLFTAVFLISIGVQAVSTYEDHMQRAYSLMRLATVHDIFVHYVYDSLEEAFEMDPDNLEVNVIKAIFYEYTEKMEDATKFYERVYILDEGKKLAVLVADFHFREGDVQRAKIIYEEALEYEPKSIKALLGLANLYRLENDLQKEKVYLQKIIKLDNEYIDAYVALSELYLKKQQKEEALTILLAFPSATYKHFSYQVQLGMVYKALDEVDKACLALGTALRLEDNDTQVKDTYHKLQCD